MLRLLPILGLAACTKALTYTTDAPGCTDYDPADPPESTVAAEQIDGDLHITRDGSTAPCDGEFEPEVSQDGGTIEIYEHWLSEAGGETCATCFVPTVIFTDVARGSYTISWYIEGVDVPLDTLTVDVD